MLHLNDPTLIPRMSIIEGEANNGPHDHWIVNPALETPIAKVALTDEAAKGLALAAATLAQPKWAARSGAERGAVLRRWGDLMLVNLEDLACILTAEQGKPLAEARAEITYAAGYFHWFAGEAERVYGRTLPVGEGARHWVEQRPLGVVGLITPWNFPSAMLARKLAAALAAGNGVLAKPALETPLSALALMQLGERAGLPKGLVNLILTDDPKALGAWFCQAPRIAKLSFTGSTETGKWLLSRAGAGLKPCTMELGGNAPFIVFPDADISAAVAGFMACKFRNAGQTCVSANRLLLASNIAQVFLGQLKTAMAKLNYGDGARAQIQLGPLIHQAACARLKSKINAAEEQGAQVEVFGLDSRNQAAGAFFAPTLVTEVTSSMQLFAEESFGPVVAVTEFSTEEEAITLANQTEYGLAAYIYSQNLKTINRCQRTLAFGMLGINEARISHAYAPFGGIKQSGFGREGGLEGISHYQTQQFIAWGEI